MIFQKQLGFLGLDPLKKYHTVKKFHWFNLRGCFKLTSLNWYKSQCLHSHFNKLIGNWLILKWNKPALPSPNTTFCIDLNKSGCLITAMFGGRKNSMMILPWLTCSVCCFVLFISGFKAEYFFLQGIFPQWPSDQPLFFPHPYHSFYLFFSFF